MAIRPILILLLASLLVATGCTVVHTVPLSAHEGDTIFVAVGSPDDEINGANTDLTYTPDSTGIAETISDTAITNVFSLYPDKRSSAWLYSNADLVENNAGHGPRTSVMAITLPALTAGTGTLNISTTAVYSGNIPSPDGQSLDLEILSGPGTASSFDYLGFGGIVQPGDLTDLEPLPNFRFAPVYTGFDNTNLYGAVEVSITVDKSGISEEDFNIIIDDKIGTAQTRNVHASWQANRLETTVYFISPTGEMQYSDVDFSIVSTDFTTANGYVIPANEDITTTWYDVDGNETAGPAVTVTNNGVI